MVKPRHDRTEPRSWFDLFLATKGWLALIAAVISLAAASWSINQYRLAHDLATSGVWIDAEITAKRTKRSGDDTDYIVTFRYRFEGRTLSRERDTGGRFYRAHHVRDQVRIKVLPERPGTFEFREGRTQRNAFALEFFAAGAGLLASYLLWFSGSKATSGIRARRYGVRTTATIENFTEIKNSGHPTGKGYMVFRTQDGLRGESLNRKMRELQALGLNSEIVVFVRGRDVWWEGDVGPRAERPTPVPNVDRGS